MKTEVVGGEGGSLLEEPVPGGIPLQLKCQLTKDKGGERTKQRIPGRKLSKDGTLHDSVTETHSGLKGH